MSKATKAMTSRFQHLQHLGPVANILGDMEGSSVPEATSSHFVLTIGLEIIVVFTGVLASALARLVSQKSYLKLIKNVYPTISQ